MIQKALDESRIRVIAVKDRKFVTKLQGDFGLGRGEAEAIVLALAEKARVLGIDEPYSPSMARYRVRREF
jgi:predicted nucleic acid-binding protein